MSILVIKKDSSLAVPSEVQSPSEIVVLSPSQIPTFLSFKSTNFYDKIYILSVEIDDEIIPSISKSLKAGGKLVIKGISSRENGQDLTLDLKISGFVEIYVAKDEEERFLTAKKNDKVAAPQTVSKISIPLSTTSSTKVNLTGLVEDDLINEDDLLNDAGLQEIEKNSGCNDINPETGKKRACKNCTCGLADEEASEAQAASANTTVEEKLVKSSSCGNCYKGDAFRCASCPFFGKPAFEPGSEKVVLSMTDDL